MLSFKKQASLTLLEIVLVLVIASSFIVLGLRQYQVYRLDQDLQQIHYNIDQIFQAMGQYYRANCGLGKSLDPATSPIDPYPVLAAGTNLLQTNGYLKWPMTSTPLLDTTSGASGYLAQFNSSASARYVSACNMGSTPPCVPTTPQALPTTQPTAFIWVAQVSVKVKDNKKTKAYQGPLQADCSSDTPTQCNNTATDPSYLIWQRLPSVGSYNTRTPLWQSVQLLKINNLQYTHDQMYELENANYANFQYYLCGG